MRLPFKVRPVARWAAGAALCAVCTSSALAQPVPPLVQQVCAQCHGPDGNSTDPTVPKIAGKDLGYLRKQLRLFAGGQRRSEVMAPLAQGLSDDDQTALAQHFARQKPAAGTVQKPDLLALGRQVFDEGNRDTGVRACAGCHQSDGAGNARFPRLAGQHAAYSEAQLKAFKSGRRATDREMVDVAKRLSDAEIAALAQYLASL